MGEMRVTKKLTRTKAVLIVKFRTPQSLKDSIMQMYCTSLEPKSGFDQSADLSILTTIKSTHCSVLQCDAVCCTCVQDSRV